jgi:cyclophilin family peptidyl-prolyl cis-trans isomerase
MNTRYATFKMDRGDIKFRLYNETPIQTNRFVHNATTGLFKGIKFYRVEPNFCIQSSPLEKEGVVHSRMYDEVVEPRRLKNNNFHFYGVLSACSTGSEHTSVGAFFIALSRNYTRHLDETQTSFGIVIEGRELIEQIEKDELINDIIISES